MSATTPAVRGGFTTRQLGSMLAAVALAIVIVLALVGLQAGSARNQAAPIAAPESAFDRGWSSEVVYPRVFDPRDLAPAVVTLEPPFDHPWVSSGREAPAGGGRGTRMAR